eukprot:gb/GFBE01010802.1/.p1 GENE.gb/GFBE01010802.1/~~gb/GFBE01010802.1/.p1  ORF type:complete len:332 (+),score=70.17 gb/GFBE01010802.1/:1-996(+)
MGCHASKATKPQPGTPLTRTPGHHTTLLGRLSHDKSSPKLLAGADAAAKTPTSRRGDASRPSVTPASTDAGKAKPVPPVDVDDVAKLELQALADAVAAEIPQGLRICILGSTAFRNPESEAVVTALASRLASFLKGSSAVVLTGGMPGVQEFMAKGLSHNGFDRIMNLVFMGQESSYGVGEDLVAGMDLDERRKVFASLGHVYLCIEGGPGVAQEAKDAFERGAFVLPIASTGGASSGLFGFPLGALEQSRFATAAEWACLTEPAEPEAVAEAVVKILHRAAPSLDETSMPHVEDRMQTEVAACPNATRMLEPCLTACWHDQRPKSSLLCL